MRLTRTYLTLPLAALAFGAFSTVSQAASVTVINQTYSGSFPATITGTLPDQNTVLEEAFTLTSTSDVMAYTTSYASGGFQPNLTLYGPNGVEIASAAPGGPGATSTPALDVTLSEMGLGAGTYTWALSDASVGQSLTATSLADGFVASPNSGFIDVNGNTRNGNYAIDLSVVSSAGTGAGSATPEPATAWLVLLPALAVGSLYGRKHLAAASKS